jgi:tetratricopeptide (TPR) repeat protein
MEMGQIDADKMYNIIMKWDWGNSDGNIYHDPETRRESITYRTNLSRLTDQLIKDGKIDKAKKVINLAMEKMPIDKFGYYSLLEPFANNYYQVGETAKAHALLDKLIGKYKDNLNYYSKMSVADQSDIAIDIVTDIERYRALLEVIKKNNDNAFFQKNKAPFNTYIEIFHRFGRDKE